MCICMQMHETDTWSSSYGFYKLGFSMIQVQLSELLDVELGQVLM